MFRNTQKSELNPKFFGAGSIMKEGRNRYLVVVPHEGAVQLLELDTFELVGHPVKVSDPNFLKEDEARALVITFPDATFSDFELAPLGLKNLERKPEWPGKAASVTKF